MRTQELEAGDRGQEDAVEKVDRVLYYLELQLEVVRGKSLLELWATDFLPD